MPLDKEKWKKTEDRVAKWKKLVSEGAVERIKDKFRQRWLKEDKEFKDWDSVHIIYGTDSDGGEWGDEFGD